MPGNGYIQVQLYASNARIPLENASVAITAEDGTAIAMRITDRSGRIVPVEIPTPDLSESQSPDPGVIPFTTVNVHARLPRYEQVLLENVQVFPDTVTLQELEMIPLSELPQAWDRLETFDTPSQNL